MNANLLKKYLIWAYILLLVGGFFYVRNVLSTKTIKELKNEKKKVEEVHPAKVTLIVQGKDKFTSTLWTNDTVGDFLNRLRDDKSIFFERTKYIYGTEISDVNKIKITDGSKWKIYYNGKDITFDIDDLKLEDESTYELKLVK